MLILISLSCGKKEPPVEQGDNKTPELTQVKDSGEEIINLSTESIDSRFDVIDLEKLRELLPPKWYISAMNTVFSPDGWEDINESKTPNGIGITVSRLPYSFNLCKEKSGGYTVKYANYRFCVMSSAFKGRSDGLGQVFSDGKLEKVSKAKGLGELILKDIKKVNNYYIFYRKTIFSDWKNPEEIFNHTFIKNKTK